jgi:DNA modification methylase
MTAFASIGPHRLYLGDAYAIRPTLGWMDADIMDPPYAFRAQGGGKWRSERPYLDQIVDQALERGFDHSIIDPSLCGAVVVFCHNDQLAQLISETVNDEGGDFDALIVADMFARLRPRFNRAALCVWIKTNPIPMRNKHYLPGMEPYIHAWNPGFHPVGDHHDMHRWVQAYSPDSKTWGHPTVKPDPVMAKIITNVAGRTVCDPFMGTGSTGVAAIKAGRIFTGIEHNPKHFETAVRRITEAWEMGQQVAA